ncbi:MULTISPECIES: GNAT family N-acetyltransferase [Citricoccus]|uniref:GNAT family N-acetyltransferase n=1 Tax=Citricoccus TaxID=169133 RepID=UPI000255EBE8
MPHDDHGPIADQTHPGLPEDDRPPLTSRVDGVTVRDAREEDHAAIAHLTVASYVDGGHVHPEDAYIEHLQDVAGRAGLARVLVGEVEVGEGRDARRVVAGSVVLTLPGMPMSETARDGEFEFRMLAVDPAVQRRGVARALVRAAIDRAQQLEGIEAVVLTTMETMTSAHRLYESEGFVRVPERDWRLSDIGQEPTDGTDQLYWVFRRPV